MFHPLSRAERARSMSFALLVVITIASLMFNVTNDPSGTNQQCFAYGSGVGSMLTIGLYVLAIAASLGALSATHHWLQPKEWYKRVLVWLVYIASVPALLLLPSSQSIAEAIGVCATSNFFTYLSWYMMGVIAVAALGCIHLLVHGERHQRYRAERTLTESANRERQMNDHTKHKNTELAHTIKQLRGPLSNLRVQIESLSQSNPNAQTALQKLKQSATQMSTTIETHLDLTKIEAGTLDLQLTDLNLRDVVENITDELRPEILKKSLILLMRTQLQSQSVVQADRTKLTYIIKTLITHAKDTTQRGTITAFVRDDTKAKKVYLDIIDTGPGLQSTELQTVFKRSAQTDDSSVKCSNNLHLCLAQKLAQAMQGNISAHSEGAGKGTRLTLVLPLHL